MVNFFIGCMVGFGVGELITHVAVLEARKDSSYESGFNSAQEIRLVESGHGEFFINDQHEKEFRLLEIRKD